MPGSDDGVFLKIRAYFGRGVQIHAFPRPGTPSCDRSYFFPASVDAGMSRPMDAGNLDAGITK